MAARAAQETRTPSPPSPAPVSEAVRSRPLVQTTDRYRVQTALLVSQPNDSAEREAEATARRVVQMPLPGRNAINASQRVSLLVARASSPASATVSQPSDASAEVESAIRGEMAGGDALPADVSSFMERRFKADFSGVRIHNNARAANLCTRLGARAFTFGRHIFFNSGQFAPNAPEGKELIAHELTHTIQQREVVQRKVAAAEPVTVREATQPKIQASSAPTKTNGSGPAVGEMRDASVSSVLAGKALYRMADGRLVELPEDMTAEEAARLEREAKIAQQKLGKGPPPKPVPDVRKPADKSEKKSGAIALHKGGKGGAAKGRKGPKTAGIKAQLKATGGKVAQYLIGKATPVLAKGIVLLSTLSRHQQTHDDSAQKLQQAEKAVAIPTSEGQSKSNAGQVTAVDGRPPPPVDANKGKQKLQDSLAANVPKSIEDVDNFKRDKKAQHIAGDVLQVVQGDKNAVVSTFVDMERTPPPAPPEQIPEPIPPPETAPGTADMNLGQGAVAPLQPEHTDVGKYTQEADAKLKEEGVTQEQLDMVDSGDLASANKEKGAMNTMAKTEPLAVQNFAKQQTDKVDKDLKQEEKKERGALSAKRNSGLGAAAQKQKGAKSALEKKRDEVAAKINGIFKSAQEKVKKKLADLETQSMKRFDDGNAQATKSFEDNVNRELKAFKDDRYSGFFGWARKAKDWLLGMDDLPQVKAIFDRNRTTFVSTIDRLVADIGEDNKRVIQDSKDDLARAKTEIKDYVDKLGPELKDIGKKTAGEVNGQLEEMDGFIRKREADLQQKLADKQQAAIKAIDDKIEKMKEAMSGALAKLGKLLLWAAKKFFTWALGKFGYSLSEIEGIINKGVAVLKAIFTKPIQFVKNLMNAAITGFKNFGANFLKHLKDALFEWLTGSLEGLKLPTTWDFKGIVGIALQMIGISYQNIRRHMVAVMGEPVVAGLEKTFTLVKTLITEGPMAAWEQLKDMAAEMRDAFVEAVKDFIKVKIIEQAITWVVSLFIPGAGIVKAVIGIYDTVVFFIQKAKQIAKMIADFLGSIGDIAAGNIGAAAGAMERGLARGLSLVIGFLAALLRLSGITAKIRDAIQKIRDKVDAVLAKVAKWIADKARKLFGAVKSGVKAVAEWWKQKKPFQTKAGAKHEISFAGDEKKVVPMVASGNGQPVDEKLNEFQRQSGKSSATEEQRKAVPLIEATRAAAVKNPNDPNLVVNMKLLFQTYDEGGTIKEMRVVRQTGKLGGHPVALSMTVDWLGPKHPAGSTPESGVQDSLMDLFITNPSMGSAFKFIRGHLLNEHLGGRGNAENMFPITANANSQHLHSTESKIKKEWIPKAAKQTRWIWYEVKVQNISSKLDAGRKSPENYVDCVFACHAILKDASGKAEENFSTTVTSTYREKQKATKIDNLPGSGAAPVADSGAKPDTELGKLPTATFVDDDETHTVSFRKEGAKWACVISSSTPTHIDDFIAAAKKSIGSSDKAKTYIVAAEKAAKKIPLLEDELEKASAKQKEPKRKALADAEIELAEALKSLLADVDLKTFDEKYKLEGLVGTYGSMPRQTGDKLTPDHQPQASLLKHAADATDANKRLVFAGTQLRTIVAGHAAGGMAINLHHERHKLGATYGRSVPLSILAEISTEAKSSKANDTKQSAILGIVAGQLKVDVKKMIDVANVADNYPDIEIICKKSKKKAKPLIDKLKKQILAGEARMLEQPLKSLKNP